MHPIERLSLLLSKFVLLGQKYSLMILSNSKRQHTVSKICAAGSQIYLEVGKGWTEMEKYY
jgi:hypothetical protein